MEPREGIDAAVVEHGLELLAIAAGGVAVLQPREAAQEHGREQGDVPSS